MSKSYKNQSAGWLALFVLVFVVLAFVDRGTIWRQYIETSDFAANSLLIQDAKSLNLWVGNYSRVGFNHPGPAILYVLALGEVLFHDWTGLVPSPFAGQLLGVALYSAAWITMLAWLFARMLPGIASTVVAITLFIYVTALQDHQFFLGIWFPHLYFFPFAVALLASARTVSGRLDALPVLALSGGFLINGHVSFVATVAMLLIGILAFNALTQRDNPERFILSKAFLAKNKAVIRWSAGLMLLFFVPLIIETIRHFPGPAWEYKKYSGSRAPNSLDQAFTFASMYWGGKVPMLFGLIASVALLAWRRAEDAWAASWQGMAAAVLTATLAVLVYARYGVDMLDQLYIGLFYYAAPALLASAMLALVFKNASSRLAVGVALALGIGMVWGGVLQMRKPFSYAGAFNDAGVVQIYDALKARKTEGRIVLDLDNANDWGYIWTETVGVEAYARRRHEDLFCVNKNWHILFTKPTRCTPQELDQNPRFFVSRSTGAPVAAPSFQVDRMLFEALGKELPLGSEISIKAWPRLFEARILESNWSPVGGDFVWSTSSREAVLKLFFPARTHGATVVLDLAAYLPTPEARRDAQFFVQGREVAHASFTASDNRKRVAVPIGDADGKVLVSVRVPGAVSPKSLGVSADDRALGVGLYGLKADGIIGE